MHRYFTPSTTPTARISWSSSEKIEEYYTELQQGAGEDKAKVEALKVAIREGFDSGIYEGDLVAEMRATIRQRATQNAGTQEAPATDNRHSGA